MVLGFTSNLRIVSLSLLLSTLAACGGGGGSEGGGFINPPNSNDNTVPTYSLSIEALDSSGEASLEVTSQESLTLNVTVTSSDGTIPVNEVVQISTTVADIDPANGSAVIDANGIATFTLDFNGTEGAGAVVASFTANGSTVEASINIESVLIREQYILTLDTTNAEGLDTNRFSALSPLTASLTLTESDGVTPVMDALVSLSTTIGTVAPELGTKLTDETGVARFTVNFADIEGAGALVGGYESDTLSLTVQKNIEAIASSSAYTLIIDEIPNNGVVTSAVDVSGSVRLLTANSSQYPVGNQIIELSSSLVDITPSSRRVRTDADGVANFVMSYKGIVGAGELSANFSRDDESATAVTAIETQVAVSEPSAGLVTSLALATFTADGVPSREFSAAQPLTLEVTMVDAFGDVVPTSGQVIELSSDVATITPDNGSAVTANGIATFGLEFNGTIGAGLAQATLNVGETSYIGSTAIQAISETPFLISLDRSGGALSVTNQIDVVATLTTPDGTPVENAILAFESDIATVSPATAVSDAQGSAAASVSFDGESGAGTFTATYELDGEVFSNSFNFDAVQIDPPYSFDFSLTSGGVDVTNTGRFTDLEPLTVVVRLTDEEGEAVVGERIALSSNIGVVANPENAEAVTDDNGNAEFSIESDGASGAGIVTATIETDIGSFSASLNVQAVAEPIPYTLTIIGITERDGTTESNTLTEQNPLLVTVELSENGIGLENRVIILEADSSLAAVDPENGASLTDANGLATFQLSYGGTTGAGTVIARFDGVAGTVSDEAAIEAEIPTFSVGSLDSNGDFIDGIIRVEPSNSIGYLGSAQLLIALADSAGQRAISTQSVRIESPCLLSGFASLNTGATVELTDGVGTTTYTAGDGCSGVSDEITATLIQQGNNNPSTATITLDINAAPAADERFITFISATPSTIALTGTGGGSSLEERSQVVFEVRDGSGNPVAGQEVTFELSRAPGGVQLSDANAITDANGQVAATVISGTVATPVRVIATTERSPADGIANLISVISDSLTISSGIVTQGRFALSADVLNPAAAAVVDGTSVNLTVSAFDRFGNAVPNGTAVSFTSECGGVVNTGGLPVGSCEIIDGGCNVEWRAQPAAPTTCSDNRVTIMAHALGEEAFVDGNADGYYNLGESFTDNSEAFRDDDESAAYEIGELFIDLDEDGVFADATPAANAPAGLFNGTACDSDGTVCSGALISVFANLEIIAGPQDANGLTISVVDSGGIQLAEGVDPMDPGSYVVLISDVDGNYPPLGTEISAEASGECEVVSPDAKAPNTNQIGQFPVGVSVIASGPNDADTDDRVTINVTIPASLGGSGNAATLSFACNP